MTTDTAYAVSLFLLAAASVQAGVERWLAGDSVNGPTRLIRGQEGCRVVAGLALIVAVFGAGPAGRAVAAAALAAVECTLLLRRRTGISGGDQIRCLIAALGCAASLPGAAPADTYVLSVGAVMAVLYCASGIRKIASLAWRTTPTLAYATSSATFGSPDLSRWLFEHARTERTLRLGVVGLELAAPLALLPSRPIGFAIVAGLAIFHVSSAFALGLTDFPLSHLAGVAVFLA